MTKERSPRFPSNSLEESLIHTEGLYSATGRSAVASEVVATSIGYAGLSGTSRTAIASLSGYGLLQREGNSHRITELALRLIRPLNADDKLEAARSAALKPSVFADIAKNHSDCAEHVLASILLRAGFTDEGAKRAAKVYKENAAFIATLQKDTDNVLAASADEPALLPAPIAAPPVGTLVASSAAIPTRHGEAILAQYQIPLGPNHAQLIFTGTDLTADDFDALTEYVALFKKQFLRRGAPQSPAEN